MATILKNQKQVFFSSNIYYYGLSIIGFGLYYIFGEWSIYINPSVIMASGTYNSVNTLLLLFVNVIPIIIGLILLKRRFKYADVY